MTPSTSPRQKIKRRPVHGVLLLDKPLGLSSNQALQKAKWLLRAEKAGHTGTLDPLASGVLPLCFGAATKFSQIHLDADKSYEATLALGVTTSTGDAEGEVLQLSVSQDTSTTEDAYMQVIVAKTAALFSAAAEVGAVVAKRPPSEQAALESYGRNLGTAFQLIDDALDYSGSTEKLGKGVGDDFLVKLP